MDSLCSTRRGVAPVISTILMVAVVVILSGTIATFVLDIGEDVSDPGPNIGETTGKIEVQDSYQGGIVRITHVAGDSVPVEELEIVVDATDAGCGRARILNLPSDATNFGFDGFANENLQAGDDSFISKGTAKSTWDIGVLHVDNKNAFGAGEFFEFRIAGGDCSLSSGDQLAVDLVHVPTNSIIITQEIQVRS